MATELKDGLGNEFSVRTKDISPSQNNSIRQNWHLSSRYPITGRISNVANLNGGSFHTTMKSGIMAAGLAANSPIVSFRFVSASLITVIRRLELSMWTLGAASFAVGVASFDAFVARTYTNEDSGGLLAALSGNVGKLRTDFQTTTSHLRVSDTGTLTVGTRTLDAHPFKNITAGIPATPALNTLFVDNKILFQEHDHALVLASNEGVIVQASVPANTKA